MFRPDPRLWAFALVAAALTWGGATPARAEESASERLDRLEKALEAGRSRQKSLERQASELKREVVKLRKALIAAAASAQRQEAAVSRLEPRLKKLTLEEEAKTADLARRREALAETLGALQRLSVQPREALIISPASAVDTLRSSLLLGAVVPELEAQADSLRRDLAALARLRDEITARNSELATATGVLAKERRALDQLLKRKAALQHRTEEKSARERRRLARMALQAESLHALVIKLEEERRARETAALTTYPLAAVAPPIGTLTAPPPPPLRSFTEARGNLPIPARGRVIGRFGESDELGTSAKGITIATRPLAQVIAPHDGRIAFAGPFRGYGQLLIIEHGEGYHTLIAGLSRIDGRVGQWLLAGEPVGRTGGASGAKQTVYVELRRNGKPINPLPWLMVSDKEGKR